MYYYILCPAEIESGGPELAHQLCRALLQQGDQAHMYYTRTGQMEPIDARAPMKYQKYGTDHIKSLLEMKMDSIVIVPEALTTYIPFIPAGRKVVWWMSVDNYIFITKEKDLKYLERNVDYHLVQSHYAKDYLLRHTRISVDKILFVSDYIGDSYGRFILPAQYRQNIVLYNPKKGLEELYPLMAIITGIKWIPLEGMTEEQMVVMMQAAKAYVDFGNHPGKDRVPREAASCGCCVITNRKGSAAFYEDVPIADEYKFEDVHSSYEKVAVLLKDICENYEFHAEKFEGYREFIAGEKERFILDVRKMMEIFRKEFGVTRKNVLLVKSSTLYELNSRCIDEIAVAMQKLGCNTCVLDTWPQELQAQYKHMISVCRFDAVIDMTGMLCEYNIIGKLPEETVYGIYLYEPPQSLDKNLRKADNRTIVFCCDKDSQNYIKQFYTNIKHTEFIPPSGSFYPDCIPYEDRTIDIIFIGSYEEPEKRKKDAFARMERMGMLVKFMEDMFEDITSNTHHTLSDCLSTVLQKYHLDINDTEFDELMSEFMDVHWYAHSYYRDKLIRTLLSAGLKIHVFGKGWETFHPEQKENLVVHEGGEYAAMKALADSKIALSIMPWFKEGFQERIAMAMLSKAVAITDESKYINANFENGKELIIYSLKDMEALAERLKYLLMHTKEAAEIAEDGYKKIQNHTWKNRVYDMLKKMEVEFGTSFMQEGEGKKLNFEETYPYQRTILLDAIYELKKMSDLVDNDMGKMDNVSGTDLKFLLNKFQNFIYRFGNLFPEMKWNPYIFDYMNHSDKEQPEYSANLFSIQCQALMSDLLLDLNGIKL